MATIRKQQGVLERDDKDRIVMSLKNLITLCEVDGLYEYPEMNNKIYLHYKGFYQIENLDKFVNLKTIYLENNMITKLTGLSHLKQLQHLFLQHNTIKQIGGLEENIELITLNLSHNMITKVEGLENLVKLENLSLGFNQLKTFESIEKLKDQISLSCCGLEDNHITYDQRILDEIFAKMPNLRVLYLQGNDFAREFPYYRKKMVGTLKELTYLDERPIFPEERVLSEAFAEGGKEKMQSILKEINEKKLEVKKIEQQENQKKNAQIKQNRIIFFENNLKKGLIEIESLKKKLNRAQLINDPYLVIQLEENIKKERSLVEDIEMTLRLLREGQKQLREASQKQNLLNEEKENVEQNIQQDYSQEEGQKLIQKNDIEKLLSSLLLGSSEEQDFDEENLIKQLEETIQQIGSKIGKNNINLTGILDNNDIKQKVQQFKTENPDHLRKIQEKKLVQTDHHQGIEDNNEINCAQNGGSSQPLDQQNYLDDLE